MKGKSNRIFLAPAAGSSEPSFGYSNIVSLMQCGDKQPQVLFAAPPRNTPVTTFNKNENLTEINHALFVIFVLAPAAGSS